MANKQFRAIPCLSVEDIKRYWKFIDVRGVGECWPWIGKSRVRDYGILSIKNITYLAHRIGIFIHTGVNDTTRGVCHSCDFPPCNNPAHLSYGTQLENIKDMHVKKRNRQPRGENHRSAILTKEQAIQIIQRFEPCGSGNLDIGPNGASALSREFKVSRNQILSIAKGRKWKSSFENPERDV